MKRKLSYLLYLCLMASVMHPAASDSAEQEKPASLMQLCFNQISSYFVSLADQLTIRNYQHTVKLVDSLNNIPQELQDRFNKQVIKTQGWVEGPLEKCTLHLPKRIKFLRFVSNDIVAVSCFDKNIYILNVTQSKTIGSLCIPTTARLIVCSPDKRYLAALIHGNRIVLYDIKNDNEQVIDAPRITIPSGTQNASLHRLTFSPDSTHLYGTLHNRTTAICWQLNEMVEKETPGYTFIERDTARAAEPQLPGHLSIRFENFDAHIRFKDFRHTLTHNSLIECCDISPDLSHFVVGCHDGSIALWQCSGWRELLLQRIIQQTLDGNHPNDMLFLLDVLKQDSFFAQLSRPAHIDIIQRLQEKLHTYQRETVRGNMFYESNEQQSINGATMNLETLKQQCGLVQSHKRQRRS